jgi:hypothetical protein
MYFEINKKFDNIIFRFITKPDNKQFVFLFLAFPPPPDIHGDFLTYRDINYGPRLKSLF